MKIKINSIFGSLKFEGDFVSIKEAVLAALKSSANLRGANLCSANLCGADLCGADLCGANLRSADLSGANLCSAELSGANLCGADLSGANLCSANLCGADLCGANLRGANLCGANLCSANLCGANLRGANLCGADLCGANLCGAKNSELAIAQTRILPDGDLIGWKKCRENVIVKILILSETKRSSAFGRKCRAESVEVLEVIGAETGFSHYDLGKIYKAGETVKCTEKFCEDFNQECASGIHFFITRLEAEKYEP